MKQTKLYGFSLMEMMVVMLIIAIVAAATAPLVSKKLTRSKASGDSPWVFTGLQNNIAYNLRGRDNASVIIGAAALPDSLESAARLFIDAGNNASHIAFGSGDEEPILLTADPELRRIGIFNQDVPQSTIAFGRCEELESGVNSVLLGNNMNRISGESNIVIGNIQRIDANNSILIGNNARITKSPNSADIINDAIAIGTNAESTGNTSIAIGINSTFNK